MSEKNKPQSNQDQVPLTIEIRDIPCKMPITFVSLLVFVGLIVAVMVFVFLNHTPWQNTVPVIGTCAVLLSILARAFHLPTEPSRNGIPAKKKPNVVLSEHSQWRMVKYSIYLAWGGALVTLLGTLLFLICEANTNK